MHQTIGNVLIASWLAGGSEGTTFPVV